MPTWILALVLIDVIFWLYLVGLGLSETARGLREDSLTKGDARFVIYAVMFGWSWPLLLIGCILYLGAWKTCDLIKAGMGLPKAIAEVVRRAELLPGRKVIEQTQGQISIAAASNEGQLSHVDAERR